MGKAFKNKTCVYCGDQGNTADHIFAKQFFPPDKRGNLPQICACERCNRTKSKLEHYLVSVLPFGGRHPQSNDLLQSMVPKRLAKNRKLFAALSEGRQDILIKDGESIVQSMAIPFDAEKLSALFGMIARALVAFHWGALVPRDYFVGAGFLSSVGEPLFRRIMAKATTSEIRGNLGEGLILYQGVQLLNDPCRTLWRFQLYGGVVFAGDPRAPKEAPSDIWASTSKDPLPGLSDDGGR